MPDSEFPNLMGLSMAGRDANGGQVVQPMPTMQPSSPPTKLQANRPSLVPVPRRSDSLGR